MNFGPAPYVPLPFKPGPQEKKFRVWGFRAKGFGQMVGEKGSVLDEGLKNWGGGGGGMVVKELVQQGCCLRSSTQGGALMGGGGLDQVVQRMVSPGPPALNCPKSNPE